MISRKERILQIASAVWHLIAEKGIRNVTLDDVAKECGLSKGGLMHYFSTKNELIETSVIMFFDKIFEMAKESRDEIDDPFEQLLSYQWIFDRNNPENYIGYRLFFDVMSIASQNPYYRNLFKNWVEDWVKLLIHSLEKGVEKGVFRCKDIVACAKAISSIYQGLASRWFLDPENHSDEWVRLYLRKLVKAIVYE